jgi:hypothetical protein
VCAAALVQPPGARIVVAGNYREPKARSSGRILEVVLDTHSHRPDAGDSQKLRALRRELNERLQRLAAGNGSNGTLHLLCECGRCSETIDVADDVYEQARSTPGVLLVKQGHEQAKPVRSRNEHTSLVEAATA